MGLHLLHMNLLGSIMIFFGSDGAHAYENLQLVLMPSTCIEGNHHLWNRIYFIFNYSMKPQSHYLDVCKVHLHGWGLTGFSLYCNRFFNQRIH